MQGVTKLVPKIKAIVDEAQQLYNVLATFIYKKLNDPQPDLIHSSYQVVWIRNKAYAYRSYYNKKEGKTRNQYLGPVSVAKDEYKKYKKAEKRFKEILRKHKAIERLLNPPVFPS